MRARVSLLSLTLLAALAAPALAQDADDEIDGTIQPDGTFTGTKGTFRLAPTFYGNGLPVGDLGMFLGRPMLLRGEHHRDAAGANYFVVHQFAPAELGSGFVAGRVTERGDAVTIWSTQQPANGAVAHTIPLPTWAVPTFQGGMPNGRALYERVGVMVSQNPGNPTYLLISPQPHPANLFAPNTQAAPAPAGFRLSGMQSPGFNSNDVRGVAHVKNEVTWPEQYSRRYTGGVLRPALAGAAGPVRLFEAHSLTPAAASVPLQNLPAGTTRVPRTGR